MDRLHVLAARPAATVAAGSARVSSGPVVPFGPSLAFDYGVSFGYRTWWYDVHEVEGAV